MQPNRVMYQHRTCSGATTCNQIDKGHGDIVNIAMALYHQRVGDVRFSRTIIDQIILNNYHTDGLWDFKVGTSAGQGNSANHFDNPNSGPVLVFDDDGETLKESSTYKEKGIQNALDQIAKNRDAYVAEVRPNSAGLFNISQSIGRLGQNLHTLADFYAHTNWVDSSDRGGSYKNVAYWLGVPPATALAVKMPDGRTKVPSSSVAGDDSLQNFYESGWVPTGLGKATLWDESASVDGGQLYSGSALDPHFHDAKDSDNTPSTHAYWNKDYATSEGGAIKLPADVRAQLKADGIYTWEAQVYKKSNPLPAGTVFINDKGKSDLPEEEGVIYVRKKVKTYYDLAFALAIQHTVEEIYDFYEKTGSVEFGGMSLQEVLKMDKGKLKANNIYYKDFPDKMTGYSP